RNNHDPHLSLPNDDLHDPNEKRVLPFTSLAGSNHLHRFRRYNFGGMLTSSVGNARFQYASDQSLLIYFDDRITLTSHELVMKLLRLLELDPIAGVRNLHPAYCSLLVN